jgi:hypothetical protein
MELMSDRKRTIAGAPERTAAQATDVIVDMLTTTLEPADVNDATVSSELAEAAAVIRMLIAGKHLKETPLTLIAEPLRLEIRVVTGSDAIDANENLGKVPGAAQADDWTLHLPAPDMLADWVNDTVGALEHVTTDAPPSSGAKSAAAGGQFTPGSIDMAALRRAAGDHE